MNPQPVTPVQLAAFLKRYCPGQRTWPRASLISWVTYFMKLGQVIILTDERGRITGATLGRFLHRLEDGLADYYKNEPGAPIGWVDAIATRDPRALPQLLGHALNKWSHAEKFGGTVFLRNGELRVFPRAQLLRFFATPQP